MRNELIMGEDKMRAWQVFDQAFNFIWAFMDPHK